MQMQVLGPLFILGFNWDEIVICDDTSTILPQWAVNTDCIRSDVQMSTFQSSAYKDIFEILNKAAIGRVLRANSDQPTDRPRSRPRIQ